MLALLRRTLLFGLLSIVALLTACPMTGDASAPIATQLLPSAAAQKSRVLVVVLPGRGDDVDALRKNGIGESIQSAWPQADVLLAGVTMPYYFQGRMPQRLHDEVIVPARKRGYREVWLAGASMGGMGALLYDRRYPTDIDGMVLMAPYLGEQDVIDEITSAGGLAKWQPGKAQDPAPADAPEFKSWRTAEREVWRYLKGWNGERAGRGRRVWIVYGEEDRLNAVMPLLAPLLPDHHILLRPGGHAWVVWTPAANEIFKQIHATDAAVADTPSANASAGGH
jgi:pimeloyl-ACP methyl ester carboxylesterase